MIEQGIFGLLSAALLVIATCDIVRANRRGAPLGLVLLLAGEVVCMVVLSLMLLSAMGRA